MRIRYGETCAVLLAVAMMAFPLAAQVSVRGGTTPSRVEQRRELERARRALEAASQSLEDALERLGRAEVDTSARAAARAALAQAGRAVDRAQAAYVMQQQRAFGAEAERTIRTRVWNAERDAQVAAAGRVSAGKAANQQGWLGIFFSDSEAPRQGRSGGFPRIVSVEPGSPADRAGLEAGDQLVAIDGRTLGGRTRGASTSVTRMLHPGTRIPVRILRGDETKEVHVLVGRRPGGLAYAFRMEAGNGAGDGTPEAIITAIPPMAPVHPAPGARPSRPSAPVAVPAPAPAFAPFASLSLPSASFGTFYFNGVSTIAGAQLWRVDDLKDYFHVDAGLLVLRVLPGTPADRAGLRSGDVIVRTDGRTVTSLRTLQRALEQADDHSDGHAVPLDVVRKGKTLHVTLRW